MEHHLPVEWRAWLVLTHDCIRIRRVAGRIDAVCIHGGERLKLAENIGELNPHFLRLLVGEPDVRELSDVLNVFGSEGIHKLRAVRFNL